VKTRRNIVIGQIVNPVKVERAREFRRNMTRAEGILWEAVRRNQVSGFHFRRQQVIEGFIVDFYCHRAGLVVEVDGGVHEVQIEYDADREEILKRRGLRILRFRNEEVEEALHTVVWRINCTLRGT